MVYLGQLSRNLREVAPMQTDTERLQLLEAARAGFERRVKSLFPDARVNISIYGHDSPLAYYAAPSDWTGYDSPEGSQWKQSHAFGSDEGCVTVFHK